MLRSGPLSKDRGGNEKNYSQEDPGHKNDGKEAGFKASFQESRDQRGTGEEACYQEGGNNQKEGCGKEDPGQKNRDQKNGFQKIFF